MSTKPSKAAASPPSDAEPSVKSVDRAIRLLKAIAAHPFDGAMFVDLSRETGFGKATTHRLLAALIEGGLVLQDTVTRKYRLGSAAMLLGRNAATQEVAFLAQPSLERIAAETGDTAFASVPEGTGAVCVAIAMGDFPIRSLTLEVGARRPLGVGAGSLALLATLSDDQVDKTLEWNRHAYAQYPAFNSTVIRAMVTRTRKDGYAFNDGHIVKGMCAIGVPVFDSHGRAIAALSMSAIAERVAGPRRARLVALLAQESQLMSRRLASQST